MEQLKTGTKQLGKLEVHDTVQVQNQVGKHPTRWDITGTIVEVRPFDQYTVKIHGSGRLTTRNRKFLRKIVPNAQEKTAPAPLPEPSPHAELSQPAPPVPERQSTRMRKVPDRLEMSWSGRSYEHKSAVDQPQGCVTASHSLAYRDSLSPVRPVWGEGIYDGGSQHVE